MSKKIWNKMAVAVISGMLISGSMAGSMAGVVFAESEATTSEATDQMQRQKELYRQQPERFRGQRIMGYINIWVFRMRKQKSVLFQLVKLHLGRA